MPSESVSEPSPVSSSRAQSHSDATFVCSWSGCGRMYRKREHLQRHERSHARDFKHEDVMTRHLALHDLRAKKPRKVSCVSCVSLKVRCDGQRGTTCSRCTASGRECMYRNDNTGNVSEQPIEVNSDLPSETGRASSSSSPGQPAASSDLEQPTTVPTTEISTLPFEPLYGLATDASESFFGWDIGDVELGHMDILNMSPLNWFHNTDAAPSITHQITPAKAISLPPSSELIRDAQPPDTPWPHVYRPSETDSQLSLSPIVQSTPSIFRDPNLDFIKESSREAMMTLVSTTNQPNWPVVDVTLFPSTQTLSVCVNLYFRHFHDTLPIIRRSKMRTSDAPPILLLAMASIGAMYSRDKLSGLAIALNELTRRAISYMRESDQRAMFDTTFVQASLLQSTFGLFCGSRMLYQHAEISRGSLVTAARRMHLLRPSLSFVKELQKRGESPSDEELRRAQADDDERRNLGWGIYLYDMQISALLNIAPLLSVGEINVPLSGDDEAYNTTPPYAGHPSDQDASNFRVVLDSLLSHGTLPQPLSSFGLSVVAHTLYRLCTDAAAFDPIFSQPSLCRDNLYRLAFPPTFNYNPQELLDQLSASSHSLPNKPNSLIVSFSALSHLGHMQFTWPGFLNNVKIAAGKSGTEESKQDARSWVRARIEEDPIGTRSILAHAGQLSTLLSRFTFDSPAETVLTLDLALTFWAILKFSTSMGESSPSQRRTIITWSDHAGASEWIRNGGQVSFQGLGDLTDLSSTKVLSIFSERLESMPWGLAQRFKHVLMSLETE
ncbi:C6 and C2H2 transcription factor [Purpureocillium lilacinum]|uniref:C6 and C2H2 transcription factor n=1 Tax=Purpureocillium lilacinum TaxID=33203 RepID=A0A2U3EN48_PURLI|nr:C6 and C2H2 transcription factor [Purpureocillium lilacinum]